MGATIRIVERDTNLIPLFATDVLDDATTATGTKRSGMASKIARAIRVSAVRNASDDIGLSQARGIENGRVYIGGKVGDTIDLRGNFSNGLGALVVSRPGVTGSLSLSIGNSLTAASLDGDQFTITNNSVTPATTTTFEFSIDANVAANARIVRITAGATRSEMATQLANAIRNAGIGF